MVNISLVVVLYNPNIVDLKNVIDSYSKHVDIILVDNSEYHLKNEIITSIRDNKRYHYIDNEFNKGIAHALNRGFEKAMTLNAEWVLTLD